jgi:hypothetical protein
MDGQPCFTDKDGVNLDPPNQEEEEEHVRMPISPPTTVATSTEDTAL